MADFTLDARQAFATFDAIERRLAELERAMKRTQATSKTVFTAGLDSARQEANALDQVQREYKDLNDMVSRFKANLKNAWDPRAVETYARAIEEAEVEMRRLERGAGAVGVNLKKSLSQETKGLGASLLSGLKGAALGIGAGISFGAAISEGIALNAEYERIKTSLTVILKDAGKADKLLGKLNQFAAETPFQSDQINRAATSLLAFGVGEDVVIDKLREIGTVSAATGKDFNELATIYGKARVAGVLYAEDINQLVEAGVPIIGEFAKQLGVSESQVKKLASQGKIGFNELETAFKTLTGEGGRFDGLLQKQSETLRGVASTLKDLFSQGLRNFFAPIAESLRDGGKALIAFLQPVQATSSAFAEQSKRVDALNKTLVPLLDRYEQLRTKTNPTKKEQAELGEVIKQIGVITPGAITEIDKYGNALSINADKSRAFLAAERARLKFVNEEAIKTVQSAKDQAEQEAKILQARVKAGKQVVIETGAGGGGLFGAGSATSTAKEVTLTAKQIEDITKKVAELTERAKGADAELKRLKGETPEPEPEKKPTEAPITTGGAKGESAAAKQLKKDLADLEKVSDTLEQVRAAVAPDGLNEDLARVNKKYDDLAKATEEGILKLQAIEKRRGLTPEQRSQLEQLSAFTVQLEERRLDELTSVLLDFNEKEIALADEQEKRKKALADKILDGDKEAIQEQKNIRDDAIKLQEERGKQLIAVLKKTGADETEVSALQRQFDLATQKARLESELQFQQQLLEIVGTGNEAQASEIKRTIAQLKAEIGTLSIEIDAPSVSGGGKKQSLFDLLGIDTSTDAGAEFAEQVEEMAGRVVAAFQEMAAARTELAQQEVEESEERISKLESDLDREIQLAELGFASNVTLKRKQLEEEKKKNAAVKVELERAKKSQLAIDTAIQASSLITSIANLFKSLSLLPFGTGIPIAIALSGLMIGFFIKSKIDAAKAAKARFGKSSFITSDGMVEGRTHAQGGQLLEVERGEMVQVGDDGGRRRVEVVRRERAREYFDLLKAANKGDRIEIARQALKLADFDSMPLEIRARLYPSVDIQEMYEEMPRVSRKKVLRRVFGSDKMQAIEVTVNGGDTTQTNRLLDKLIQLHIEAAGAEKWSADGTVRTKGNTKTKYR